MKWLVVVLATVWCVPLAFGQGACCALTLEDLNAAEEAIAAFPEHRDCERLRDALQVRMLAVRQLDLVDRGADFDPLSGIDLAACPEVEHTADWWFSRGGFHLSREEHLAALGAFALCYEAAGDPMNRAKACTMMGICHIALGDTLRAVAECRDAAMLFGEAMPAVYALNLAHVLQSAGMHHTAMNWLVFSKMNAGGDPTPNLDHVIALSMWTSALEAGLCDRAAEAIPGLELGKLDWGSELVGRNLALTRELCSGQFDGLLVLAPPEMEGGLGGIGVARGTRDAHVPILPLEPPAKQPWSEPLPVAVLVLLGCWLAASVGGVIWHWQRRIRDARFDAVFNRIEEAVRNPELLASRNVTVVDLESELVRATKVRFSAHANQFGLTMREQEVLMHAVSGMSAKQIAADLHLSPKYIYNIFSVLRLKLQFDRDQRFEDWYKEHQANG